MGISLKNIGKKITDFASRSYDQANMFDNNRTYKQRTPTQSKSNVSQVGQILGQTGRGVIPASIKTVNTARAGVGGAYGLAKVGAVSAFGTDKGYQNEIAGVNRTLTRDLSGGILGMGGLVRSAEEAGRLTSADIAKKSIGTGVEVYLEGKSSKMGGLSGKTLVKEGLRQGFRKELPNIAKNALVNTAQGGVSAYNQGASGRDILKSAAVGGVVGTAADLGLGLAGAGLSVAKSQVKPVVRSAAKGYVKATAMPNPIPLSDNMLQTLGDFGSYKLGEYRPNAKTTNDLFRQSRAIARAAGIDIDTGSPVDINNRIGAFIEDYKIRQGAKPQVGAIGKDVRPDPVKKAELDTNKGLEQLSEIRKQYASDQEFFDKVILENVEAKGKIGEFARHIANRDAREGSIYNKNYLTEILDDELAPINSKMDKAIYQGQKNMDLKRDIQDLERSTGQKGLYRKVLQEMKGMTETESNAYMMKAMLSMRDNGVLAMDFVNRQNGYTPKASAKPTLQDALAGKTDPVLGESYYRATDRNEIDAVLSGRGKFGTHEVGKEGLTHVTPDKSYAEQYMKSSPDGVMVEFKPTSDTMKSRNGYGITKDDIARVTDTNGNVIYEASASTKPAPKQVSIKNSGASADNVVTRIELDGRKYDMTEDQLLARLIEERKTPSSQRSISQQDRISRLTQALKDLQEPKTASTKPPVFERDLNTGKMKYQSSAPQVGKTAKAKAETAPVAPKPTLQDALEGKSTKPTVSIKVGGRSSKSKVQVDVKKTPESLEKAVYGFDIPEVRDTSGRQPFITQRATRKVQDTVNKVVDAGLSSGKKKYYAPARAGQMFLGGLGENTQTLKNIKRFKGGTDLGADMAQSVVNEVTGAVKYDKGTRRMLSNALDPELAKKRGESSLLPENLKPVYDRIRQVINAAHEEARPFIGEEAYQKNKGKYITRSYEKYELPKDMAEWQKRNGFKEPSNLAKKRKTLTKGMAAGAVDDPLYNLSKQIEFVQRAKTTRGYANWLSTQKHLVSDGPKTGYVELGDSPWYGELAGKYVRKDIFESIMGFGGQTEVGKAVYSLLNAWERGIPRRITKSTKTIYNPAIRVSNALYNYVVSLQAGVSPTKMLKARFKAEKMINQNTREVLMLKKAGIIGTDITANELGRQGRVRIRGEEEGVANKIFGAITGLNDKVGETYGKVDDRAKVAFFLTQKQKGFSDVEAVRRTQRYFQDYDSVGKAWDVSAKSPVFGKAFGRFMGDFIRRTANLMTDRPLTAVSLLAGFYALTRAASSLSGESEDDRNTREDRLGAGKFPFTDISTEVQLPWGAVDLRRFIGPSVVNDNNSDVLTDSLFGMLPFDNPVAEGTDGTPEVNAKAIGSDPLLGPIIQQGMNRDFRQKPIDDPDAAKFPNQPLPEGEKMGNRVETFLRANVPPVATNIKDTVDAFNGKEDFYGRTKTPAQALLRNVGVRMEDFGTEQAKESRSKNEYFEGEFARADKWLKENKDLAENYNKFKGREKVRSGSKEGTKLFDLVSPEKWNQVSSDSSLRLYNFLRGEAVAANKKDGKPVDPVFVLPTPEQQKMVLELRSRPTGDDIEKEEILRATQPWYQKFEDSEGAYYDATEEYFKKLNIKDTFGERVKEYNALKNPQQSDIIKRYYEIKEQDNEAGKDFYADNADQLSADFKTYRSQRLDYINAKRKIEGFPPIDEDAFNNITFGYEDDEQKVANQLYYKLGRGGRYGSGSSGPQGFDPNKYAISLNAGGSIAKPKISVSRKKRAKTARKASKPTVSIKKSMV